MSDQGFEGVTGQVHPIVQVGDPVLSTRCAQVTEFDAELTQLIADMFASMYAAEGVGLAANQIGVSKRVFVYDCPDDDDRRHVGVVVNPVLQPISSRQRRLIESDEGCLSVHGEYAEVARTSVARVSGVDHTGEPLEVEGTGFFARCLQHECDHLEGMLYIDRLSARERRKVLKAHSQSQGS